MREVSCDIAVGGPRTVSMAADRADRSTPAPFPKETRRDTCGVRIFALDETSQSQPGACLTSREAVGNLQHLQVDDLADDKPTNRILAVIEEKDRFYSRLAAIPGIRPMPSVGSWILLQVDHPTELARRVNRRLLPGTVSIARQVDSTVRVRVADPATNEELLRALRELCFDDWSSQQVAKAISTDSLSEFEQGEAVALKLFVSPGKASVETISDVLNAISDLHRAAGGLGLQFSADGSFTSVREAVNVA